VCLRAVGRGFFLVRTGVHTLEDAILYYSLNSLCISISHVRNLASTVKEGIVRGFGLDSVFCIFLEFFRSVTLKPLVFPSPDLLTIAMKTSSCRFPYCLDQQALTDPEPIPV